MSLARNRGGSRRARQAVVVMILNPASLRHTHWAPCLLP
jgi:hypothetical protein